MDNDKTSLPPQNETVQIFDPGPSNVIPIAEEPPPCVERGARGTLWIGRDDKGNERLTLVCPQKIECIAAVRDVTTGGASFTFRCTSEHAAKTIEVDNTEIHRGMELFRASGVYWLPVSKSLRESLLAEVVRADAPEWGYGGASGWTDEVGWMPSGYYLTPSDHDQPSQSDIATLSAFLLLLESAPNNMRAAPAAVVASVLLGCLAGDPQRVALALVGTPSSGKTSIVELAAQLVDMPQESADMSPAWANIRGPQIRGPMWVEDYKPRTCQKGAIVLIRGAMGEQASGRARSDGTIRKTLPIRCLPILTAEALPSDEWDSTMRRLVVIDCREEHRADLERYRNVKARSDGAFQRIGAEWIRRIADDHARIESRIDEVQSRLLASEVTGVSMGDAGSFRVQAIARMMATLAIASEELGIPEPVIRKCFADLTELSIESDAEERESRASDVLDRLASAVASRVLNIANKDTGSTGNEHQPIDGWIEAGVLYLSTKNAARKLDYTRDELKRHLRPHLAATDERHLEVRKSFGGARARYAAIAMSALNSGSLDH